MSQQLTVKEALEQGYDKCLYANEGFQALMDIKDMGERSFIREIEVVNKTSTHPQGIDAESIAELLAENIYCNHTDATHDDTDDVYEAVKAIDFTDVAKRIQAVLNKMNYYTSTGIRLVP